MASLAVAPPLAANAAARRDAVNCTRGGVNGLRSDLRAAGQQAGGVNSRRRALRLTASLDTSSALTSKNRSFFLDPAHSLPSEARPVVCRATSTSSKSGVKVVDGPGETVFFDGGTHWGDFLLNLSLGFTGVWLPVTLTSLFRALNLRYRFTDRRFTIMSSLDAADRRDYPYSVVTEVRSLPRFIGEWGDIAITLKDKTIVELKAVPKFREIAKYIEARAQASRTEPLEGSSTSASPSKGF